MKTSVQEPGIIEAIFIMGGFAVVTVLSICPGNVASSPDNMAREADANPAGMLERNVCNTGVFSEKTADKPLPSKPWDPEAGSPAALAEKAIHHG